MEILTVTSEDLVTTGTSREYDCVFPIDPHGEAVKVYQMRGMITAPFDTNGNLYWYFGFTKNPKSPPASAIAFWHDHATFALLQVSVMYRLDGAAGGSWNTLTRDTIDLQGLMLPYKVMGIFWNAIGASRRFRLEINYEVIRLPRMQALALIDKYNRRG